MMYGSWGGWGWMVLMPLFWIALVGLIVWAVVAATRRPVGGAAEHQRRETPREILDRRFASGDIDAEAYTRARDQLTGTGRQSS